MIGSRSPSTIAAGPMPARITSASTLRAGARAAAGRHDQDAPGDVRPVLRVWTSMMRAGRRVDAAPEAERLVRTRTSPVGLAGDERLRSGIRRPHRSVVAPDPAAHGRPHALLAAVPKTTSQPRLPGAYQAHLAESVITAPSVREDRRDVGAGVGDDLDAGVGELVERPASGARPASSRPVET